VEQWGSGPQLIGAPRGVIIAVSDMGGFLSAWLYWDRDIMESTIIDWIHAVRREMPGKGEVIIRRFTQMTRRRLEERDGWNELRNQQERDLWDLREGKRPW